MTLDPRSIADAAVRIAPHAVRTPLFMTDALGPPLACKAEHLQRTSSFKFRGALNRLLDLDAAARERGVVTASTGNHGIGVATAGRLLGIPVTVCVAQDTDAAIVERLESLGARVERVASDDCAVAETSARDLAGRTDRVFVSPYNDPVVIAGQGTIAVELLEQLAALPFEALDHVVVAVGGGGLISGIARWIAHASPGTRVVGAQPEADAAMYASVQAGRIVDAPSAPTLSHSTAGGIEPGAITFELCRDLVSDWILVEEDAIAHAVRRMIEHEHQLVEGAAGVAFAAAAELAAREPDARIAVISCGARLTPGELRAILGA